MPYERRWLAVVALGLSLFLSALDATIVALALPTIAQHFQLSDSLASSVTLSYAIPLTLLILPAGDLATPLSTALQAWDAGQRQQAHTLLHQILPLAREMGYL
jgi:MFS family permease